MAENLPQIHVVDADATYLMWLDCSALTDDSVAFTQMIREKQDFICRRELSLEAMDATL